MKASAQRGSQQPFAAMERVLVADLKEPKEVNTQLEKMGYNIGIRLIDEFLAKAGAPCRSFREALETVGKVGFKMFLGVTANVTNWTVDAEGETTAGSLVLDEIPFVEHVEIPEELKELSYCCLLCGVVRGALEQIGIKVSIAFVRDVLRGDDAYELRVTLVEKVPDEYPFKDDE